MHAAAGQALETTLGDRAWEHAARIAGHLYEAGDRERAAGYFAKSGERRLKTRQLEAAARDLARGIALTEPSMRPPEELVTWLEQFATAVRLVRASSDAGQLCQRLIERIDAAGARDVQVRARVAWGEVLVAVQHMEAAKLRLSEAEAIAAGDEKLVKSVLLAEAELATHRGDFKQALDLFDRLHSLVQGMHDASEKHRVALYQAQARAGLGDRAAALGHLAEADALLPEDRPALIERTKVRSLVDYFTRDFRAAALHSEKAIDMGREAGITYEVAVNLQRLGEILVHLDDLPRAYGAIRQSLALCEEYGYERLGNSNRMFLAFLDGIQGTVDGEPLLRQGIAYAEGKDFTWDVIGGRLLLAKLLHRSDQLDAARTEYDKTRALAAAAGHCFVAEECEIALRKLEPPPLPMASA
jgi:tetratricopeptide (TPR) repeat protein